MRRNTDSSVGVFLLPGDAYFYSPEYARLVLAEQIHWIVKGHAANFDVVDEHVYTKLLHQLQKKAKKGPITFVIDGLAQKGQPEYRLNSEILQLLPKSQPDFRFLITGSSSLEEDVRKINGSLKVVSLIEVAIEEATEFFSDIPKLSAKDISDIRRFCGGSVGQMSKFKGLIENHQLSVESMLAGQGGGLDDLMALEWKALESDEKLEKILAFLCFANRQISLNKISEMIGVDLEGMSIAISKCAFVEVEGELKNCSIRSTAQKNFLRKKLHKYESEIQDLYLADLLRNPESNDSVLYLPNQLMLLGKHEDLVSRLDVNHFCRLLKSQRSLRALKFNSDLGLAASRALNDEAGLARFALSGSVIGGLTFSGGSQSRIEALIRLGAVESAVELAFSSPTNEERLQLLAATGKALFDEKLHINHEVKQEIKRLIELVSAEALGPLAIDIACDLIVVDLEVAFDLFNKANSLRNEAEKNNSDLIQEDRQKKGDDNEIEESSVHHLKLRMSQRHHQRFSEALGQLVDRTSFEQISRRVTQDNDGSSDLVFLKEWIERRKRDPDAWKVANMALDLMLKDLARAPRADDLRAIAVVLPYITDQNEAEKLTKRIEALVETDLFLGTTVESVRLQMLLQRAKYVSFPAEAELAILDLFLNIEKLEDISTQVSCLSWMLYALQRFDGVDELERKTSLLSQTTSVLLRGIDQLLDSSADHFNAVKGAIFALAKANVQMAMDLAGRLNTEERRDSAFALLAHEFFKNRVFTDNPGAVITCIERISDENTKSIAIIFGLYKIADFSSKESMACCNSGIVSLWKKLRVANYRFQACSYALQIQLQTAAPRESIEELKEHLNLLWPSILVDWVKSNLAYCLVRDIAKVDREFSEMWLQKVVEEEKIACAPTEQYAEVLRLVASLAVRGYSYVADDTSDLTENNFKKVDQLIASLAIPQDKIILWCDLGIRLFYSGKKELARMICVDRVESILSEQYLYNEYVKDLMIADAAPFLFTMHQALANFHINKIRSQVRKDIAISDVCYSLLRKKSSSDVYKTTDNDEHDIDSNVATSVISLVENVKTDWVIFDLVKVAANSLTSKRNESRIRRPQVIDFLNSLEIVVRKKLPEENNIKHDGFKISSLSQIYKARSAVSGGLVNVGAWESLYRDARSISNVADRSIATAFVAVAAKNKILSIDQNWIAEVKADAQLIPTMIDRIDRYVWLAQIMESAEKSQALILAKNGMELSVQLDKDVDAYSRQKRILDLVYNIDPDAVDKYIDLADRDPARKDNKKSLQDRAKLIKSQKDAAEAPAEMDFSIHSNEDLAEL